MKYIFYLFISFFSLQGFAQEPVRVMYYNILNFPNVTPGRVSHLRTIVQYSQPDILVVNELLSADGADLILTDALNVWGETKYQAATFVNGPDTDNMLYYNSDKLGLVSQLQIPTGLRDISEYELFYKSPGLSSFSDTIFFNMYSVHLKAGSGHFAQRKEEVQVLKFHLNSKGTTENIFVGGDFNFYSGNESGCLSLRELGDVELFDPIDQIGDWSNNSTYAEIHTQSTRTSPLDDGSGGGMDDRFDLIFTSQDVFNNENGLSIIEDSYLALGQDGDRFNSTISVPYNSSVPDSVVDALYFMSDHLPVIMDVNTDYTASIAKIETKPNFTIRYDYLNKELVFSEKVEKGEILLFDLTGKLVFSYPLAAVNSIVIANRLHPGVYVYSVKRTDGIFKDRLIIN